VVNSIIFCELAYCFKSISVHAQCGVRRVYCLCSCWDGAGAIEFSVHQHILRGETLETPVSFVAESKHFLERGCEVKFLLVVDRKKINAFLLGALLNPINEQESSGLVDQMCIYRGVLSTHDLLHGCFEP
jgi:hypothetical protein